MESSTHGGVSGLAFDHWAGDPGFRRKVVGVLVKLDAGAVFCIPDFVEESRMRVCLLLAALFIAIGCGGSDSPTGDSCSGPADCGGEQCIIGGSFPDGVCTPACDADVDCPTGFSCISRSSGICLQNCATTDFCQSARGPAWQCREESREDGGGEAMVCIGG